MAPMRCPSFLFPLLLSLILAQVGGHTHRIAHLGEQPTSAPAIDQPAGTRAAVAAKNLAVNDDGEHPYATVCADCLALCGLDLALTRAAAAMPAAPADSHPAGRPTIAAHSCAGLRPRCRAPPTHA